MAAQHAADARSPLANRILQHLPLPVRAGEAWVRIVTCCAVKAIRYQDSAFPGEDPSVLDATGADKKSSQCPCELLGFPGPALMHGEGVNNAGNSQVPALNEELEFEPGNGVRTRTSPAPRFLLHSRNLLVKANQRLSCAFKVSSQKLPRTLLFLNDLSLRYGVALLARIA